MSEQKSSSIQRFRRTFARRVYWALFSAVVAGMILFIWHNKLMILIISLLWIMLNTLYLLLSPTLCLDNNHLSRLILNYERQAVNLEKLKSVRVYRTWFSDLLAPPYIGDGGYKVELIDGSGACLKFIIGYISDTWHNQELLIKQIDLAGRASNAQYNDKARVVITRSTIQGFE
jgi:hypothetical protein